MFVKIPFKLKKSKSKYYTHKLVSITEVSKSDKISKHIKVSRHVKKIIKDKTINECDKMSSYQQLKLFGYWTHHKFIPNMYLILDPSEDES